MQIQISVQIQITVQIQIQSTLQIPENAEDWCVGGWAPALCVGRSQWGLTQMSSKIKRFRNKGKSTIHWDRTQKSGKIKC